MRLSAQRGNVAVYLLFSIVAATAAGYGVYTLLKNRAQASNDSRREQHVDVASRRPPPAPVPTAVPEPPAPTDSPVADDTAERDAIMPQDIDDPEKHTVLLGRPGIAGALEVADVDRTIKRYHVRYERCMRRAGEQYRLSRGQLRVTFVIGADGAVTEASARATGVETTLADCVVDTIRRLRFDAPADGRAVKVVYPMLFVPGM